MSAIETINDRHGSFFVPHDLEKPIAGSSTGDLAGLRVAVKDMYDIAGTRTGNGNPQWVEHHGPAERNAVVIDKILAAGATIIGKTICDEFFCSIVGKNVHYGTPLNVRAPGRIPGGSSSGSAAATAANACDFALGSDTGGSVRVPASFCGLFGLRPTHGRIDVTGVTAMAPTFDVVGFFANSAGIMQRVGHVLLDDGSDSRPIARLLIAEDAFEQADPPVAALCRQFIERAQKQGALPQTESALLAPDGFEVWREAFRIVQAYEAWQVFGEFVDRVHAQLGSGIKERMAFAATVSYDQSMTSRKVVMEARKRLQSLIAPGTVVALPTTPCIAPRIDMTDEDAESFRTRAMRLTCSAGVSGLPQISIPAGTVNGCPAGFSLIGWSGSDEVLLQLAGEIAKYCGIVL